MGKRFIKKLKSDFLTIFPNHFENNRTMLNSHRDGDKEQLRERIIDLYPFKNERLREEI